MHQIEIQNNFCNYLQKPVRIENTYAVSPSNSHKVLARTSCKNISDCDSKDCKYKGYQLGKDYTKEE